MHTKITSALKVSTLALVLSVGISYVYAWTAPTSQPPGGNVSAPINTSSTAQAKAGTLSATDLGINGNFVDTNMTIPSTPAGGTTAVAGNNWPNFSDVAANAVKLAGLTASDILAAQTSSGGMSQYVAYGSTTCATGWTTAYAGVMLTIYNTSGVDIQGTQQQGVNVTDHMLCVGSERTAYNSSLNGADNSGSRGYFSLGKYAVAGSPALSCAVCVR